MKKKLVSVLLTVVLTSAAVSGCTGGKEPQPTGKTSTGQSGGEEKPPASTTTQKPSSQSSEKTTEDTTKPSEKTTEDATKPPGELVMSVKTPLVPEKTKVKVFIRSQNIDVDLKTNEYLKYIAELTNIEWEQEVPPISNYTEKLNLHMSSGDLADMVYTQNFNASTKQWCEEGLFLEITDKVGNYEALVNNILPSYWTPFITDDGKKYGIPKSNLQNYHGVSYRTDYLEKAGQKVPTTVEEFEKVGLAMKDIDVKGDGSKVYLLSFNKITGIWVGYLASAFNVYYTSVPDEDGSFGLLQQRSGYMDYLDYLRRLYEEGLIDPEYISNDTYGANDKFYAGRIAFCDAGFNGFEFGQSAQILGLENNDEALKTLVVAHVPSFGRDAAHPSKTYLTPSVWGAFYMTNPDTVDLCLSFLNWGNSYEGVKAQFLGKEGVHYISYDEKTKVLEQTPEQVKLLNGSRNGYNIFSYGWRGDAITADASPGLRKAKEESRERYLANTEIVRLGSTVSSTYSQWCADNPDLVNDLSTNENLYVTGSMTRDAFLSFLNDEYLAKATKDGIDKVYAEACERAYQASKW